MSDSLEARYEKSRGELEKRGQLHVLRAWNDLDDPARESLMSEIEAIPWAHLDPVIESHVRNTPAEVIPANLEPAHAFPPEPTAELVDRYREVRALGNELIAAGKVAAFTVAGGQGSRLGFDGPKGAFAISPIEKKTLFQLFAEIIAAEREHSGANIPWYVMTNPSNHDDTLAFFEEHGYFGLPESDVIAFVQDMLPAFDFDGRILMAEPHRIALAPSGHGGSLTSLVRSDSLADMRSRGVEIISYFQVDNPLVKPFDPLFLGLHRQTGSEMSSKVTAKTSDTEKVGNLCMGDGRLMVIEYSDFPDELSSACDENGARRFDQGNLAIHLLDVDFVARIATEDFQLPFHRAEKKVACVDDAGVVRTPSEPNGVKLEAFIFDALPLAENPLLLTIDRSEEFSPVKNASGSDSVETSTRDQIQRAARWLEANGVRIARNESGEPDAVIEISPRFARGPEDLAKRELPQAIASGETVYLE